MKITQSLQPWQEGPPPTTIDAYAPAWTNAVGLGVNDDVWDVTMALMLSPQFMHVWKTKLKNDVGILSLCLVPDLA